MNKTLMVMLAVSQASASLLNHGHLSGTPGIPNRGGHRQQHPHAPNDGRWHMKYHRNRH